MNKKNGFTLIELLAVIVILAIVALIATPIVMNLIEYARKGAIKRSVHNIQKGVETFYTSKKMVNEKYTFSLNDYQFKGDQFGKGTDDVRLNIIFNEKGEASVSVYENNACYYITASSNEVIVDKKITKEECLRKLGGVTLAEGYDSKYDDDVTFWGGNLKKREIEQIDFVFNNVPTEYIGYWDVSKDKNGEILAYYTDIDGDSFYELTITSSQRIMAPVNSSYLFQHFTNLHTIKFDNFDTSNVTNMKEMFFRSGDTNIVQSFNIVGLDDWDTSNVTNMNNMLESVGEYATTWSIGDLSKWNTSKVTDMSWMFAYAGLQANTFDIGNLDNWDTSNVTNMCGMFNEA